MPLSGKAKTDYQRSYMRDRRTAERLRERIGQCSFCRERVALMPLGGTPPICTGCVTEALELLLATKPKVKAEAAKREHKRRCVRLQLKDGGQFG
jgi:hypothetical protein